MVTAIWILADLIREMQDCAGTVRGIPGNALYSDFRLEIWIESTRFWKRPLPYWRGRFFTSDQDAGAASSLTFIASSPDRQKLIR
jgi:hypothetical protein